MITRIYACNAGKIAPYFRPKNNSAAASFKGKEDTSGIRQNKNECTGSPAQTATIKQAENFDSASLPEDVKTIYLSAQDMLQNLAATNKSIKRACIEAQFEARKAQKKAKETSALYKGKIPAKVAVQNNDGSEDIMFFKNGTLTAYRKGEKRTGEKTQIDKLFVFENGKFSAYKEGIITIPNKGSAKQDIEISKSLEFSGISTFYKENYKSIAGKAPETDKFVYLVLGKPWFFEEGITEKYKERQGHIKRRIEFSNEEKTTYSYQEETTIGSSVKSIAKGLYVENSIPYRYCEDEFFQTNSLSFNSYQYKKIFTLTDGKWHTSTMF